MLKPYVPLMTALGALILVITFALMNRTEVPVWVFGWRWWVPLVVVVLLSFLLGVGIGLGVSLRRQFYLAAQLRDLETARQAMSVDAGENTPQVVSADGTSVLETSEAVEAKSGEAVAVMAHE